MSTLDAIVIKFLTQRYKKIMYLQIVSGGEIIVSDQIEMYTRNRQLSIALSQDMAPTARLVAYYLTTDGQVVADSLSFHINNNGGHKVIANYMQCSPA